MAQKQRLVAVRTDIEQTIVNKASGASDSKLLAKLKDNTLNTRSLWYLALWGQMKCFKQL